MIVAGIYIIEGMTLKISNLSIHMSDEGNITQEGPDFAVGYDACIAWARIALEHRDMAKAKMEARRVVWRSEELDECQRGRSLEAEFYAAMQAVVASVSCIDALYDHLLPYSPIDTATKKAWSSNKTARYIQIAETVRAAFAITPTETKALREGLQAMFSLRDAAVHPSNAPREPYPHPELDIATDWRLTVFRGDVADSFVCNAVGLLWDVTRGSKFRTPELAKFIEQFRERVDRLLPDGRPLPDNLSVTYRIPRRSGAKPSDPAAPTD